MVNPDWDLRGYLSHSGKPPGGTLHTGRPDRCSFHLILILLQAWRGTLALNHRQRVRADGWRNDAYCRQLVLDEAPFVCLSLILRQDMVAMPTLFFSSDCIQANMYNFPTFWIQPSLWTSLSFLCFRTQPGWKMRSWATKVTRQPWVSGQGAEFLGLGEVTDHRQSHLDGEMYF